MRKYCEDTISHALQTTTAHLHILLMLEHTLLWHRARLIEPVVYNQVGGTNLLVSLNIAKLPKYRLSHNILHYSFP